MPDTENTPGSASATFETYQRSLRRAKRGAAEAREAADALKTLKETVPLWWQMFILAHRDVDHRSLRKWQEKTLGLIDSAQADFLSGMKSRFHDGAEKVNRVYSDFKNERDEINESIQNKEKHLRNIKENIKDAKNSKERKKKYVSDKNDKIDKEKWFKKVDLVKSIFVSFGIALLISIPIYIVFSIIEAISGGSLGGLLNGLFITIWVVATWVRYSSRKEKADISELNEVIDTKKDKINKISSNIKEMKSKKDKIYNEKCSMEEDIKSITIKNENKSILEDIFYKKQW